MGLLSWGAAVFSLIYLYYAIKNNPICFLYGIIGSAICTYVSYSTGLKFDAALQVFYISISFLGYYRWKYGGEKKEELPITVLSVGQHTMIIALGTVCSIILIYLSKYIEFIRLPMFDATSTVFLIIGSFLLIERKLSSWIYLVIADFSYVYIYGVTDLWPLVGLMVVYIVFGINGFMNWKKLMKEEAQI